MSGILRCARRVIATEIKALRKIQAGLGREFTAAVNLLLKCLSGKGKIVVTGLGKNLHIAEKISATFTSTGCPSVTLNPVQAMHGDIGILSKEDVLLVLSYSGESEELNSMLPVVKRLGVKIIAVTASRKSSLARYCCVLIPAAVDSEACPFNLAPTSSTTAALAIGDALAMVLVAARGFKKEDYARLHPGGAIGRTLFLRVADIMRTGDRCASVRDTATVKDAMLAMTRARAGSVGVVDSRGKCLGIFTDGDLRRHLFGNPDLIRTPIRDVMTRSPISVTPDMPAVDVLNIYETHNIDDLLVVDKTGKLVGAVDIQDLPKFKIM